MNYLVLGVRGWGPPQALYAFLAVEPHRAGSWYEIFTTPGTDRQEQHSSGWRVSLR